ncbi:MAG: hypothetical protein SFZ23_02550 [Planctomycetota bacterium]|nr:hypothetical protein [Planctomycetota bacterium]
MSKRKSRALIVLSVVSGTCLSLADPARAVTLNWNLLGSGSAGTASNWNPAQVPTAADLLVFDLNGVYTVNFPVNVNASSSWSVRRGTMTSAVTGTHTTSGNVTVGSVAGVAPRLTLTSGTLISNGNVIVGTSAGAIGDLRVRNGATRLATAAVVDFFLIGSNGGTGSLSVEEGGLVEFAGGGNVGNPGSSGTITVTGFDTVPNRSSTLTYGNDLFIGSGGDGTLNVLAGGLVVASEPTIVGFTSTSVGSVSVGGIGVTNSRFSSASDLRIGHRVGVDAAGTGTFTVDADGVVEIAGATIVGDPDGGSGQLVVNTDASFTTQSLTLVPGSGTISLTGGVTNINGGFIDNGNLPLTIPGGVSQAFLNLNAGADASFAAASNLLPAMNIGSTSNAVYRLNGVGTTTTLSTGGITLGSAASGYGALILDTGATLTVPTAATVAVGANGRGALFQFANTTMSCGDINIAANAGSRGDVEVNTTSTLNVAGEIAVGGAGTTPGVAGGTGELLIQGGRVNVTSAAGPAVRVFPGGTLTVSSAGQLNIIGGGSCVVQGAMNLDGFVSCTGFTLSSAIPASLARSITSTAGVTINPGATANLTGDLSVSPQSNFSCSGTLNVGNHILDVTSGTLRISGDLTIGAAGRVRPLASSTSVVNVGGELAGDGVFQGNLDNSGLITATGNGLRFESGLVRGVGQGMSGTEFSFNFNAEFEGTGVINADVAGDSTSLLNLTGPLTIGRTTSANGVRFAGTARLNSNVLTLRDLNDIVLPSTLDFGSSTRVDVSNGGNAIQVPIGGEIIGSGLVQYVPATGTRAVTNAGRISPGSVAGVGAVRFACNTLRHEGDLIVDADSETEIDTLVASAAVVTLAPGSRVAFRLGFVPTTPFRRTFLSAGTRLGLFSVATFPPVPLGRMRIDYTPTGADLVYCAADYNGDGTVDFFDYLDFVIDFDNESTFADFNHDGVVDFFDYLDFVAQLDAGCE